MDNNGINTFSLRRNERETSPHKMLCYDTETKTVDGVEQLFMWRAVLVLRHDHYPKRPRESFYGGDTAEELADMVEKECVGHDTLWIYSHNENFDLTTTRLPLILTERGWEITKNAFISSTPWGMLSKGDHKIRIVDSFSIFPTSVKALSLLVGVKKEDLPPQDGPYESWAQRCNNDALIIARALESAMNWWDNNGLGNWSVTGPSTGWNVMLHMKRRAQTVIQQDDKARKWERGAISGGRREAFKVGRQIPSLFCNLDFHSAHASVCATCHLPLKRLRRFDSLPIDAPELHSVCVDIIADCVIKGDSRHYAVRTGSGMIYPAGRFKTRLCGPEIREAKARGELESIGEGYAYKMGPSMRNWGLWILELLDSTDGTVPEVVKVMAKAWSRSVPGKWAGRTSRVVLERPYPSHDWKISEGFSMPGRIPMTTIIMGGKEIMVIKDVESDESFPAVLAFIQAYCRVCLNHVIDGTEKYAVQCNTDGCVINVKEMLNDRLGSEATKDWTDAEYRDATRKYIEENSSKWKPLLLRDKKFIHYVDVLGAQHIILDSTKKMAGIPHDAKCVGDEVYRFTVWPSLSSQIKKGSPNGYRNEVREISLKHVPISRWRTGERDTIPVTMTIDAMGNNKIIVPWEQIHNVLQLWPNGEQHPLLAKALAQEGL